MEAIRKKLQEEADKREKIMLEKQKRELEVKKNMNFHNNKNR